MNRNLLSIPLAITMWQQHVSTSLFAQGFIFPVPLKTSSIGACQPAFSSSATTLYSTKEKSENKASSDEDREDSEEEYVEEMLAEGTNLLDYFGKDKDKGATPAKSTFLTDSVLLGANRTLIERDPILRQVTSEVRVWNNFRQEEALANPLIPVDVVAERTWDTAEDAFVHLRRMAYEKGAAVLTPEEDVTRKTIVVLGSGWAAHALMKVADCQKLRIIVVSPTNHFVFTPMLASASVGTVEYRSMTEAVRAANPMIQ